MFPITVKLKDRLEILFYPTILLSQKLEYLNTNLCSISYLYHEGLNFCAKDNDNEAWLVIGGLVSCKMLEAISYKHACRCSKQEKRREFHRYDATSHNSLTLQQFPTLQIIHCCCCSTVHAYYMAHKQGSFSIGLGYFYQI